MPNRKTVVMTVVISIASFVIGIVLFKWLAPDQHHINSVPATDPLVLPLSKNETDGPAFTSFGERSYVEFDYVGKKDVKTDEEENVQQVRVIRSVGGFTCPFAKPEEPDTLRGIIERYRKK